jgi:hypothetical protein
MDPIHVYKIRLCTAVGGTSADCLPLSSNSKQTPTKNHLYFFAVKRDFKKYLHKD